VSAVEMVVKITALVFDHLLKPFVEAFLRVITFHKFFASCVDQPIV
jgi:hypothetical protein